MVNETKINKAIDVIETFKNDLKEYEKVYKNRKDVPIGLIGIRINQVLKILKG